MDETKVSRLADATQKVNDWYKSNGAFIFFMSATTIFALLQVILYSLNLMTVNGTDLDGAIEHGKLTSSIILLTVSIIACYCGFIGGIMLFRGSLSFIYWQNTATILATFTQAIASMWFGAFVSIYFLVMNFIRYYVWKNELLEKWNISQQTIVVSGLIILVILLALTNTIVIIWGDAMYSNASLSVNPDTGWMANKNYSFDAIGASFNMAASYMMMFKCRWSFVLYAIAKVFTIWNYADAGLIVPIIQMMLFWIMDFTGFIGWSIHSIKPTDTAIETDFE